MQLVEGMSSRKRRPNWTDQECLLLAQLMQERKEVIRGKCSSGVSIQDKRQAWEEIAQSINIAFPQIQRTVSDCNKKWENLLAKSKEEIKRQRRQGLSEGLSVVTFSPVTQVVISVMNLSEILDREDASLSEFVEAQQNSSDEDGHEHRLDDRFSHPLRELHLPTYPDAPPSPAEQKMSDLMDVSKSLAVHFSAHHHHGAAAAAATAAAAAYAPGRPEAPACSPPAGRCTTLQERVELEMSVLRRQEAVLKLQEEYYTLKIQQMKKQTGPRSEA
ncbi:hypothetical protein EYF80_038519 [Liparis tanakae]|uniref:Myb-like domain-containing protein n=1 Tax=Liparis tanakae TaxID=230148 RepID=A0A4Z2GCH3_9TELE|nr:hypothetical protein EYF80_038519 [Liparis tanakae]